MTSKKYSSKIFDAELKIQDDLSNLKKDLGLQDGSESSSTELNNSNSDQSKSSSSETSQKEAPFYIAIFFGIICLVTFFIFNSKAKIYKENRTSFFTGLGLDKKYVEQGGVGGLSDIINNTQDGATILVVIGVSGLAAIIAIFAHINKSK